MGVSPKVSRGKERLRTTPPGIHTGVRKKALPSCSSGLWYLQARGLPGPALGVKGLERPMVNQRSKTA